MAGERFRFGAQRVMEISTMILQMALGIIVSLVLLVIIPWALLALLVCAV